MLKGCAYHDKRELSLEKRPRREKRMNKRGQFYLLAAVIIITGIVGIASVKNFAVEPGAGSSERIYDLSREVGYESANVIDFGIYNQSYGDALIENWIDTYANYSRDREGVSEWLFVYGNSSEIKIINFTSENKGEIGIPIGGKKIRAKSKPSLFKEKRSLGAYSNLPAIITVKDTLGIDRKFKLNIGENFYFVVAKIEEQGTVVERGDD